MTCLECFGSGETLVQANSSGGVINGGFRTCQSCFGGPVGFQNCAKEIRDAVENAEAQFPSLKELLYGSKG